MIARLRLLALVPAAVLGLVVLLGYAPFLGGSPGPEPAPELASTTASASAHTPFDGLGTFLARWQKNDFLFMVVHENLRHPWPDWPDHWFVLVPGEVRQTIDCVVSNRLAGLLGVRQAEPAFLLTQALMGAVVASLCAFWALRIFRTPKPEILLRGIALVLIWGWLLSSTPHPWYLLWSLPFLVFEGRRSWFLLPGLAMIYNLRFWVEYQALPGGEPAVRAALAGFDYGIIWFEYAPFFIVLLAESGTPQLPSDGRNGCEKPDPPEGAITGAEDSTP